MKRPPRAIPETQIGFYVVAATWKASGATQGFHEALARVRAGWQPPGLGLVVDALYGWYAQDRARYCSACVATHIRWAILKAAALFYPCKQPVLDEYDEVRRLRRLHGVVRIGGRAGSGAGQLHLFRGEGTAAELRKCVRARDIVVKSMRESGYRIQLITDEGTALLEPIRRWRHVCGICRSERRRP